MTNYSLYGNANPPGNFALYDDGDPSIAAGHRFYITSGILEGGSIVGGKVWVPSGITMPPQVKMQWYVDGYTSGTPNAEKVVDVTAPGGTWQTIMLDTPLDISAPGVIMTVVVTWMPSEHSDKYLVATTGGRPNISYVQSTEVDSLYWSEYTSQEPNVYASGYRIPANGTMVKASEQTFNYGIDIIVSDNVSPPEDPDSVYAQLVAEGHEIKYIVVAL